MSEVLDVNEALVLEALKARNVPAGFGQLRPSVSHLSDFAIREAIWSLADKGMVYFDDNWKVVVTEDKAAVE